VDAHDLLRSGALGQLDRVVTYLAGEHVPPAGVALASLLSRLPWRLDNTLILEMLLLDDHPEVISAAAATLARHPDAVCALQMTTLDHLRVHPNR
jgi:hypothetical protein